METKFRTENQSIDRRRQLQLGNIPYPIPSYYNFYLFFGLTNLTSLFVVSCSAVFVVENVQPLEWFTIAVVFLFANFIEYICHRGPMHRRLRLIPKHLFKPHTLSHHEYFTHESMSMKTSQEAYKVLFFFWDTLTLLGLIAPIVFVTWYFINRNVAGLTLITLEGYFLFYEWLHLIYHAPARFKIGSLPLLGALKRHHQIHHNKTWMNDYNFNLTLPIWDWILGSLYRSP